MSAQPGTKVVAGIFREEKAAAAAVRKLVDEHFDPRNDLSVIVSRRHERENVLVWQNVPLERGAAIGATLGAVLAGAGVALAGLTFGPFTLIAAGPVLAALEGAYAGGATGFAIGALMGLDLTKVEADFGAAHIHDGVVWVGVHATGARVALARKVLADAGARHFTVRDARQLGEAVLEPTQRVDVSAPAGPSPTPPRSEAPAPRTPTTR